MALLLAGFDDGDARRRSDRDSEACMPDFDLPAAPCSGNAGKVPGTLALSMSVDRDGLGLALFVCPAPSCSVLGKWASSMSVGSRECRAAGPPLTRRTGSESGDISPSVAVRQVLKCWLSSVPLLSHHFLLEYSKAVRHLYSTAVRAVHTPRRRYSCTVTRNVNINPSQEVRYPGRVLASTGSLSTVV